MKRKIDDKLDTSKRHKGGRPEKNDEEKLSEIIKFRLTKNDRQELIRLFEQEKTIRKISFQSYLREVVLSKATARLLPSHRNAKLQYAAFIISFEKIAKELVAIRANHNQTVKKINALPLTKELKNQLKENFIIEQDIITINNQLKEILYNLQSKLLSEN